MKLLMVILLAVVLFSCNNSDTDKVKTDSGVVKTNTVDTTKKNRVADTPAVLYCYVRAIEKKHDSTVLVVDSVFFYHGPNLDSVARKHNATKNIYENEYILVDKEKQVRRVYLPDGTPIKMDVQIAGEGARDINTYAYFSKHSIDNLFMLRIKDNKVVSIDQVFTP